MAVAFLLALQAASAPAGMVPLAFDLASLSRPRLDPVEASRCAQSSDSAIVVCGRRPGGDYQMARWALIFPTEGPLRAEAALGGGATGAIYGEAVPLDRGVVSQRAMVGIKIPF